MDMTHGRKNKNLEADVGASIYFLLPLLKFRGHLLLVYKEEFKINSFYWDCMRRQRTPVGGGCS